ncbi:MAG: hypothetical protein E3J69_04600 [Anaerolineales bacterium]|nr:MAG: hypothetical protein E3J69_04600 [Anaerolineales bacterium]
METFNAIFVTLIPSLLIAIATSLITVHLSLRKFYTERWWEKKAEAYEAIIESLYNMKTYLETYSDAVAEGRDFNESSLIQIKKEAIEGRNQVLRAATIGSFLISDEAATSLFLLRDKLRKDIPQTSLIKDFDEYAILVTKHLYQVLDIAKKDLRVG